MKKITLIFLLCFVFTIIGFAQQKSAKEFQKETNEHYSDEKTSPLLKEDLINFKGLPFFKIDSQYIVVAKIERVKKNPL